MWTFDNPALNQLQEKYHFTPTQEWLDHVRLSCVRFNDGGSGSFVNARGLVQRSCGPRTVAEELHGGTRLHQGRILCGYAGSRDEIA